MSRSVAFATSDPRVREVAERAAVEQPSAVALALSVYLFACASQAGVLLSSVSILASGYGARRAIDGRTRQPGRGFPRPRGFLSPEEIPTPARVAVPAGIPAVYVAWGYGAAAAPAAAFRTASAVAARAGAPARAELLKRAGDRGGSALQGSALERELTRRAGAAEGGLVSPADFEPATDVDHPIGPEGAFPWGDGDRAPGTSAEAVLAVDQAGGAAVVCYDVAEQGFPLFDGELVSPLVAQPVLRGVPRVRPGTPLSQRCAGRLEFDTTGRVVAATWGTLRVVPPR